MNGKSTRSELLDELADAMNTIHRLEMAATDARHHLAHHAVFGNRKATIDYALGALCGKPMVPCSCVGGKP